MTEFLRLVRGPVAAMAVVALLGACASPPAQRAAVAATPPPIATAASPAYETMPPDKDSDLKLYTVDGRIVAGAVALGAMQRDAGLVLWLAGNQFFAMDDVVRAFQAANPAIAVGLVTLPPGLLLAAIQKGGWRYGARDYPGRPDVYASVNLGHLKTLKQAGLMDRYSTYMHNEMVLMVARGNPKNIRAIDDLKRDDVRTSMPNPLNEGIMQFYGRRVLERHGLWQHVSGGKECLACQPTANNWFTEVHHRETPERIADGRSDTGLVWVTEAIEAVRAGAPVEGVKLVPADSLRDEVSYAIGAVSGSPRAANAARYLAFLASPAGQAAYARFGFVGAAADELAPRPIP